MATTNQYSENARTEDADDILEIIRSRYDSLSNGQKKIAQFLFTQGHEAILFSAGRLAAEVGVSSSTVVRMAQTLGYEGFPQLQQALQERFLRQMSGAERFLRSTPSDDESQTPNHLSILHQVMRTDASHIESALNQLAKDDFQQAVDLLTSARRVYIIGLHFSAPLALITGLTLSYIRPDCFVLQTGVGDFVDRLTDFTADDVLFSICYPRYMRDTLLFMELARKRETRVLTLTDSVISPAAQRADVTLAVPHSRQHLFSIAPFSVVHAIVSAVALKRKGDAHKRLRGLNEIFVQFQLFERTSQPPVLHDIAE